MDFLHNIYLNFLKILNQLMSTQKPTFQGLHYITDTPYDCLKELF